MPEQRRMDIAVTQRFASSCRYLSFVLLWPGFAHASGLANPAFAAAFLHLLGFFLVVYCFWLLWRLELDAQFFRILEENALEPFDRSLEKLTGKAPRGGDLQDRIAGTRRLFLRWVLSALSSIVLLPLCLLAA